MLKLNPVLQIQGEKLDAFAKARGKASAKKIMLKAMQDDLDTRFAEFTRMERCIWRLLIQVILRRQRNGLR